MENRGKLSKFVAAFEINTLHTFAKNLEYFSKIPVLSVRTMIDSFSAENFSGTAKSK